MKEIWENEQERDKMRLNKISFQKLLLYLEEIEHILTIEGNEKSINTYKKIFSLPLHYEISQLFHNINFQTMIVLVKEIIGVFKESSFNDLEKLIVERENYTKKINFMIKILINLDLVFPKQRIERGEEKNENPRQTYSIPLLFPSNKPNKIMKAKNNMKQIVKKKEWKVIYNLPFKPSSVWKMLFLRVRKVCCLSGIDSKIEEEVYWLDGFIFSFNNGDKVSVVEMKIFENPQIVSQKHQYKQVMQIKITTNDDIEYLFQSIHQSVKEFVSEWMVSLKDNEIRFSIERKTIKDARHELIPLKLVNKRNDNEEYKEILCLFCGHSIIFIKNQTEKCPNCFSDNFLIENEIALLGVTAQGGFGRIFKAIHLKTGSIVAIKERISEKNELIKNAWKQEIMTLQTIFDVVPDLFTSRLICVLNDTPRALKYKYLLFEWIEGGNLKQFSPKNLRFTQFNSEIHFLSLMLQLFIQLKKLHKVNIIHRDSKFYLFLFIFYFIYFLFFIHKKN